VAYCALSEEAQDVRVVLNALVEALPMHLNYFVHHELDHVLLLLELRTDHRFAPNPRGEPSNTPLRVLVFEVRADCSYSLS